MEYPYDRDLDPTATTMLALLRDGETEDPDEEVLELIRDDMPGELKALLHTMAVHGEWCELDLEAWSLSRGVVGPALFESSIADFERDEAAAKLDLERAVAIGGNAGGDPVIAAGWLDGDSRMTLVMIDLGGDRISTIGSLADLVRLADQDNRENDDEPTPHLTALLATVD